MKWLARIVERWRRAHRRSAMWKHRTAYTFTPRPDARDTLRFWRNSWKA